MVCFFSVLGKCADADVIYFDVIFYTEFCEYIVWKFNK